jgi:hypothetical protein
MRNPIILNLSDTSTSQRLYRIVTFKSINLSQLHIIAYHPPFPLVLLDTQSDPPPLKVDRLRKANCAMTVAFASARTPPKTEDSASPSVPSSLLVLDVHVAARDLPPTGSFCVLLTPDASGGWEQFGRTEVSPTGVGSFQVAYVFEHESRIRIAVYSANVLIGAAETTVPALAALRGTECVFKLRPSNASLVVNVAQQASCGLAVQCVVHAHRLLKVHTFSRDCPYFQIETPWATVAYRSETLRQVLGGTWSPFTVELRALCDGDLKRPITVRVFDKHSNRPPVEIGFMTASLEAIQEQESQFWPLERAGKPGKKAGEVRFMQAQITKYPTLYDYLCGGLQISLATAIDFTGSNGIPSLPSSLHYVARGQSNQYESCIHAIGSRISPYDREQQFAVFGFGGIVNGQVNHRFPLTFCQSNPHVSGLEGILSAYRESLQKVELSGPTLFEPLITDVAGLAAKSWSVSHTYTVLMILTDGTVCDEARTIEAIIKAADTALSIVIIGLGPADFSAMSVLDGQDGILKSRSGERAKRSIVRFVTLAKFENRFDELAAEALGEIPAQVHAFCADHGFIPTK